MIITQFTKGSMFLGTVLAVLSFFIFGLISDAHAEILEYSDYDSEPFQLNSGQDGRAWPVGQLAGGAIMSGTLSFDVVGLRQSTTEENTKIQVFAMDDSAQPTLFSNHGYYMHLRARSWTPGEGEGSSAIAELKGQIDCQWTEGRVDVPNWNENHVYHFTFNWTSGVSDRAMTVIIEDRSETPNPAGEYPSWTVSASLPWPFLAQSQEVVFGSAGLANHGGFPAQAGATYSNITLNTGTVTPGYDDFAGYSPCDSEGVPTNNESREDKPGTDLGDPYDDPNNPYDTCACTSVQGESEPPCKDPKPGDSNIDLAQAPFGIYLDVHKWSVDVGLKVNWTLEDILTEIIDMDENERPEPALDINFAPAAATTGEMVTVAAAPQNFRTLPRNMMFNWCLTRGDTGLTKTYNETLASGGGEQAEVVNPTSWQSNGCCSLLTRTPSNYGDTDIDNDGIGDNWERRYFTGKTINGVQATADNVLDLVLPGDDYDNDGYFAIKFKNQKDQYITLTPALQNYQGTETYYPGGDDLLTNIEEYILDTNPTMGDTDSDGYGDDMDYLGTGAMTLPFEIDVEPGPGSYGYLVTVAAVGTNQNNLVGIAGRSRQYNVSEGDVIQVNMASQPQYIAPTADYGGDSFSLLVNIAGGEVNPEDLYYEWNFNGESICDHDLFGQFCDVGSYQINIGPESGTSLLDLPGIDGDIDNIPFGTDYQFIVSVLDPSTRRTAQSAISVPIVLGLELTTACVDGLPDLATLPADVGEPIEICLQEILDNPGDWDQVNFQWYLNGTVDQTNSGLGRTSYPMIPSLPAGNTEALSIKITEASTGNLSGVGSKDFAIQGPKVEFISPPLNPMSPGIGPKAMKVTGRPGERVVFIVAASNFPATAVLDYQWVVGNESDSGEDMNVYSFTIPDTSTKGATFPVSVQVRGILSETGQVFEAANSVTLVVGVEGGILGSDNALSRSMAAVVNLIPLSLRTAVRLVVIALILGVFAYVVLRIARQTTISR